MQTTFPRLMLDHAKQRPTAPALREKVYGIWQTTTWADLAQVVRRIACGLHEAGMVRDDHVVVVGENRPRLYACTRTRRPRNMPSRSTTPRCASPSSRTRNRSTR